MKFLYLAPSLIILLLALVYRPEWILMFLFTGVTMAVTLIGLYCFIASHINMASKSRKQTSYTKDPPDLEAMRKYLTELEPKPGKPQRLPVIYGRMLDDTIQQLVDLTLKEAIGNWLKGFGLQSDDVLQSMKEDVWKMVQNLQERLIKVDQVKVVAVDMVMKVTWHFERIRLADSSICSDKELKVPHLASADHELSYLRHVAELVLTLLLPATYAEVSPVKHLLKEILVCKVLYPAIETVTDPDYINQKILLYVQQQPPSEPQRRKSYTYAASFEDFIQMIKESNDTEVLKHIRNSIVNEIKQASTIHTFKKSRGTDTNRKVFGRGIGRGELLQGRQVKRYINQLTYAKSQCEKRLAFLGWGCPVEEAVEATTMAGRKMFQLDFILENVICRQFLAEFLEQSGNKALLRYWEAVDQLRQANRCDWHQLGADIFYTFINTPSPDIEVDKPVLKRMEAFLLGNQGPEVFYEVQEEVMHTLEEKVYPSFLVSDAYQRMETTLEEASDAEEGQDASLCEPPMVSDLASSEGEGIDQSNYARRKLDKLQDKLDNKMQALQALRSSLKPESRVLSLLETEVEELQGEKRQLEAHMTRTEAWSEHLGQWRAVVQSAELSEERDSPQFVLVVHVLEDESDSDAVSTGWVVLRKLSDFQELHRKLCQLSPSMKQQDLPSQSLKFRFGKVAVRNSLEKAKAQIQKYLKFVLEDETLNQSEALYAFLSPSSEHLKQAVTPSPKKNKFSLATLFKSSSGWSGSEFIGGVLASGRDSDEDSALLLLDEADGRTTTSGDLGAGRDGIAEPLYSLLGEVFDLRGVFMWLRKTLITFVQITYDKTINRQVRETVAGLFSEHVVYTFIQFIIKSWWVNGKLLEPPPPRTEEEKVQTRLAAREHFLSNIPEVLSNLVGHQSSRRGATKVFETLQDPRLNKQLFYDLFEVILHELFPEWKDQKCEDGW